MKLNFKKLLLTGTAIVAVSVVGSQAQAAAIEIADQTLTGAAIGGNNLIETTGNQYINLNLDNTDQTIGAGVADGISTAHSSTLYIYDSNANNVANTLTLTGNTNALNLTAATKTVTINIGRDQADNAGSKVNAVNLIINKNVAGNAADSVFNIVTTGANGHNITFAEGANAIDLATGAITLNGSNDTVTFSGTTAQDLIGEIKGGAASKGKIVVTNAAGVTFQTKLGDTNKLASIALNGTGKATFKAAVTADALTVASGATAIVDAAVAVTAPVTNEGTLTFTTDGGSIVGNVTRVGTTAAAGKLNVNGNAAITGNVNQGTVAIATGKVLTQNATAATDATFTANTITLAGLNSGLTLNAADTKSLTLTGAVTATTANQGILTIGTNTADVETYNLKSNVGTSDHKLASIAVGSANAAAVTANAEGNLYSAALTIDNGDILNLVGKTQTVSGTINGIGANQGTLNVGSNAVNTDVTFESGIAAAGNSVNTVKVFSGSTARINAGVTAGTAADFDGTLYLNRGAGNYTIDGANALTIDGKVISDLNSALTVATGGGGSAHFVTLADANGIQIGNNADTTITTSNQFTLANALTLGHAADARTVTLNINRGQFWNATNVIGTSVSVFASGGNDVTLGANSKLSIHVSDTNTFSFDNNDIINIVSGGNGGGTDLDALVGTRVILNNTALLTLTNRDAAGAVLTPGDDNFAIRIVHNNPASILTNSAAANTASAIMSITDTGYGTRWGELAEVGVAGIGNGTLGAIAPNATGERNIGNGNTLREARNNLLTASTADAATNLAESLGPVVDGGASQAALNVTSDTLDVAGDRLASIRGSETGMAAGNGTQGHRFWAQGFGRTANQDRRDGVDGYDADTWGMAVGLDTETLSSNGILGVAFSYGDTEVDGDSGFGTNSEVDSYQVTLYGDYDIDPATFVTGMLAYTWHDVDTTRNNVGGVAGAFAHGDYDANQFTAQASIGRDYQYDSMRVTPNLLAHWSHYDADGYTETGAGNANLIVDQDTINVFELGAGVEASWLYQTASGMDVEPSLHAGYRYDFIGDEVSTTNRFVGGGPAFVANGADPAKHSFNVGAELDLYTTDNWEFKAGYDFDFRSDYHAHSGLVRAGVKF